ncbi:hypothetical protein ACIOHS_23975 [Streptomyces sp. NPDC088253]|uniref:hypothetical protein n=1 Tax=Streptomyces sp. NPDC088253 TaxID=3365846 RepID=UPI00381C7B5B
MFAPALGELLTEGTNVADEGIEVSAVSQDGFESKALWLGGRDKDGRQQPAGTPTPTTPVHASTIDPDRVDD